MGNTSSFVQEVEPDPWWEPNRSHGDNSQSESQRNPDMDAETQSSRSPLQTSRIREGGNERPVQSMWYHREQILGQTIQHLAEENMRISSARRAAEKRIKELEVETQSNSEELDKLRSEAEKAQQVFEKLHAQIQSGREDRQMMASEMERIRSGFDAEREAKEQLIYEMSKLREERDRYKREADNLSEQLNCKVQLVEKTMASFNQERMEKQCIEKEVEKLREELIVTKESLVSTADALNTQKTSVDQQSLSQAEESVAAAETTTRIRSPEAQAEMERFQEEMNSRREVRQRVMQAVSKEIERLKTELNSEREARQQATDQLEQILQQTGENGKTKQEEALALQLEHAQQKMMSDKRRIKQISQENTRLQAELDDARQALTEKTDDLGKLQTQLDSERGQTQTQIEALKEVANICKEMLNIREGQVIHLKEKLREIEESVTNKVHEKLPVDLKSEYEAQIENIRNLKNLYEERMKIMLSEKEKMLQDSEEKSQRLDEEIKKCAEFEQQLAVMKSSLEEKEEENSNLQIQLDNSQDKSHGLAKELALINNLFTQMLIGSSAADMDLDRLTRQLQENHDLITEITIKEDSSEVAAVLPKLLLDLVNQVDSGTVSASSTPTGERNEENQSEIEAETDSQKEFPPEDAAENENPGSQSKVCPENSINGMAVEDIALNLPKVWKVLMELLSHHVAPSSADQEEKQNSCYKSVDTPSGPRLVISVSQTFLRLKDLILEKKSLQKELNRLKQLNGHLEHKLNDQESKLSMVSTELRKTWNVVDQMQTQHQKLHTHEKILRYELHEKRLMLNELKQELEYCREKWERARQKNTESEVEWKKLRKEFASRKNKPYDELNNSGESGFLDERGDESCEDDDTTSKDTGQLDSGIELPNSSEIRTSSPLETNFLDTNLSANAPTHISDDVLNQSQSEIMLGLEPDSLPSPECTETHSSSDYNNTFHTELQPSNKTSVNSFDPLQHDDQNHLPDCRVVSPNKNCFTISMITLLKQQLAFFSRNLDCVSSGLNDISGQNLEALESIFSLPPIQIPKLLNDTITEQNCFHNYCYNDRQDVQDFNEYSFPSASTLDKSGTFSISDHDTSTSTSTSGSSHSSVNKECEIPQLVEDSNRCSLHDCLPDNSSSDCSTNSETSQEKSITEITRPRRTPEEIAEARAERLQRLEEQCQQLFNKVTRTTHRSTALCNRLEELHEQFRSSESPPNVRNDLTQTTQNIIPNVPSLNSSRQNPTNTSRISTSSPPPDTSSNSSSNQRHELKAFSEPNHIPTPPSLPRELPSRRIPTESTVPSPPPLPQVLPSERIPTSAVTDTCGVATIPVPPPMPHSLRGIWLPTSYTETISNVSDSDNSTHHCANETTRQIPSEENLPQQEDSLNSSAHTDDQSDDSTH